MIASHAMVVSIPARYGLMYIGFAILPVFVANLNGFHESAAVYAVQSCKLFAIFPARPCVTAFPTADRGLVYANSFCNIILP